MLLEFQKSPLYNRCFYLSIPFPSAPLKTLQLKVRLHLFNNNEEEEDADDDGRGLSTP